MWTKSCALLLFFVHCCYHNVHAYLFNYRNFCGEHFAFHHLISLTPIFLHCRWWLWNRSISFHSKRKFSFQQRFLYCMLKFKCKKKKRSSSLNSPINSITHSPAESLMTTAIPNGFQFWTSFFCCSNVIFFTANFRHSIIYIHFSFPFPFHLSIVNSRSLLFMLQINWLWCIYNMNFASCKYQRW